MNYFKRLQLFLWNIDPGYFRLKHALKTVLAILIALALVRNEPLFTKVMAGLACGFSMQGIVAKSYLYRVMQCIIFDVFYFCAFLAGLLVRDSSDMTAILLVCLGFTVNYLRRFGLQNSMAPMMAWLLGFFATILPFGPAPLAWHHIHGLLVGLGISLVFTLFVFPENYARLFVSNSNRLFKALAAGMNALRADLVNKEQSPVFELRPFIRAQDNMHYLIDSNKIIEQSGLFEEQQRLISDIFLHEYALVNAYSMMLDAYRMLHIYNHQLTRQVRLALGHINKQFVILFTSMSMRKDYAVSAQRIAIALPQLAERLSHEPLDDPSIVMIVLNLKLSLGLLNQHVTNLLEGNNEA